MDSKHSRKSEKKRSKTNNITFQNSVTATNLIVLRVSTHCTRWGIIIFRSLVAKFKSTHFNVVNKQLNSSVALQFDLSETTQVLCLQTRVLISARKTLMRLLLVSLDKNRCVSTYQSLARFMTGFASLTNTCTKNSELTADPTSPSSPGLPWPP